MSARKLFYLGPQGTFTHQAAVNASQELAHLEPAGFELVALDDVPQILEAVQQGEGWGVVAWENNVEGYVVPNLDALIDAKDLAGFARVGVDVTLTRTCVRNPIRKMPPLPPRIRTGSRNANVLSRNIVCGRFQHHPMPPHAETLQRTK